MTQAADCEELIEAHIDHLEALFGSFPVNQTTVSLSEERYERARTDRDRRLDAYVEVRNDDADVLHVDADESVELPSASVTVDGDIERQLRRHVRERTGVEPTLDGIEQATIAGIRNDDSEDSETVYRLVVVFSAHRERGQAGHDAVWQSAHDAVRPRYA
jgi:hypothetical protein